MPTNHDETLLERYTREAEIDARMMAKAEIVKVPRELLLECINTAVRAWGVGSSVEVRLWKALAQPVADEQGERELMQLVDERDRAEEWANKLAAAIASHAGAYIGEHSNMNCPWAQALEAIEDAARIAQAAPQPCRTPEAAATRQKDEAEAVKLQRILFDRHMDCRPADTGLMGWAAAVLSAPQPEQSGLAGHVCGGDAGHNTVNIQLVDRAPWGDLRIGAPVTLAALSAQGGES